MIRQQIIRICANYTRLIVGFVVGLLVVRQLLAYGEDIFSIYTIVTVGAGVGIMLKEMLRISLVPILAENWQNQGTDFAKQYSSAFSVSLAAAALGFVAMSALAFAIPNLLILPENVFAAQIFVMCRALILLMSVALAPLFAMQAVSQRFVQVNVLIALERIADLLALLLPLWLLGTAANGSDALVIFAVGSVLLTFMLYGTFAIYLSRLDGRLRPRPSLSKVHSKRRLWIGLAWAALLVVSFNLYFRFNTFFINMHFGITETVVFGICVQIVGMLRQLTSGIIRGLDAVVARFTHESNGCGRASIEAVLSISGYLQSLLTSYAILLMALSLPLLLKLWIGEQISNPTVLPSVVDLSLIMAIGMSARSFSEIWMNRLQGEGKLGSYVRYTASITLLNPIAIFSILILSPGGISLLQVGFVYTGLICLSHLVIVPYVYIREYGGSWIQLYTPIFRGMATIPIAAVLIYFTSRYVQFDGSMKWFYVSSGLLVSIAAVDCFVFLLRNHRKI